VASWVVYKLSELFRASHRPLMMETEIIPETSHINRTLRLLFDIICSNDTSFADNFNALQSPRAYAIPSHRYADSAETVSPPRGTTVCCTLLRTCPQKSAKEWDRRCWRERSRSTLKLLGSDVRACLHRAVLFS
jgi:hypothetical protein